MPPILTWCMTTAAYWQLQKSPRESPRRRGVLAYDRTTATTHFLGFQKREWYHGAADRVSLSTLARITPREVHSIAILARFTNCLNPYVWPTSTNDRKVTM